MDELFWVGQCPWIAAGELSPIMDRHVSTINRNLWPLYDDGLVDFIEIWEGRARRAPVVSHRSGCAEDVPRARRDITTTTVYSHMTTIRWHLISRKSTFTLRCGCRKLARGACSEGLRGFRRSIRFFPPSSKGKGRHGMRGREHPFQCRGGGSGTGTWWTRWARTDTGRSSTGLDSAGCASTSARRVFWRSGPVASPTGAFTGCHGPRYSTTGGGMRRVPTQTTTLHPSWRDMFSLGRTCSPLMRRAGPYPHGDICSHMRSCG